MPEASGRWSSGTFAEIMSFFSSLMLFHPNPPPTVSVKELYVVASRLRNEAGIREDSRCSFSFRYGDRVDKDYKSTVEFKRPWFGTSLTLKDYKWSVTHKDIPWEKSLCRLATDQRKVYRASIKLGWLSDASRKSLARTNEKDSSIGIYPDSICIGVNPVYPRSIGDEDSVCAGLLSISFPGNGYFSWDPTWTIYAEKYRHAEPIIRALAITRQVFPVSDAAAIRRVAEHLGPLFLNRDFYQDGDWILSISESG